MEHRLGILLHMRVGVCLCVILANAFFTVKISAGTCTDLAHLRLESARVLSASVTAPGGFLPENVTADKPEAKIFQELPEFCRVVVEGTPSSGSRIAIEVWMPITGWNSKIRGQGNGGFAGAIDYRGMARSIQLGYATSASDAGHKGEATDASWALHHPEKTKDFGYRAVHVTADLAKTITQVFYGAQATHSYFDSCSDGGREALMEAQRFPTDYDGILAGAPANDWTHLLTAALDLAKTTTASEEDFIPPEELPVVTAAVLKACDTTDGVEDGILEDPRKCHFDPVVLRCNGTESGACLSAAQIQTVKKVYAGGSDTTGKQIFPGLMPTSEAGDGQWKDWVTGPAFGKGSMVAYSTNFFQYMVFSDAKWNYHKADISSALEAANRTTASILNSTDPNLKPFYQRGGKLILYHGWLDSAISPLNTIKYYRDVVSSVGQRSADEFLRLYMVPGMGHCAGGPGPFVFGQLGIGKTRDPDHNVFVALERWVESGTAPGPIIGKKLNDDKDESKGVKLTRPLCPFPQIAVYDGKGDTNAASSFSCK
jgi:feruloyl esterase